MRKRSLLIGLLSLLLLCGCANTQSGTGAGATTSLEYDDAATSTQDGQVQQTKTVSPPESYGEWFLSPVETTRSLYTVEVGEAVRNWVLKTPGQVTETRGDLVITLEFFKETYRMGEGLQVRATVYNSSSEPFSCGIRDCGGGIKDSNNTVVSHQSPLVFRYEQGGYWSNDTLGTEIPAHESIVREYLFVLDPAWYQPTGEYSFFFSCIVDEVARLEGRATDTYYVYVPLEVVGEMPSVPESYGEWFLSEPITLPKSLTEPSVPSQYENWVVKTPKTVVEDHGLIYTVTFFKDTYRFGEGLQVLVRVSNPYAYEVPYTEMRNGCWITYPGGETKIEYTPLNYEQLLISETGGFNRGTLAAGEVFEYEHLFVIDPQTFDVEGTYTFHFIVIWPYGENLQCHLEIPLEVVAN